MENSDTGSKKNVDNIFRFSFPKQSFYIYNLPISNNLKDLLLKY